MIRLTDKELLAISEELDVPYDTIQRLYSMRMLHEPTTINLLIRHDFKKLSRMGKYRPFQVMMALSEKYHVPEGRVRVAVYKKDKRKYYCAECNKEITRVEYNRSHGMCDACFAKTIEV